MNDNTSCHRLEEGDGDAAGVGEDVRHKEDFRGLWRNVRPAGLSIKMLLE
jgi:hypothetical protein